MNTLPNLAALLLSGWFAYFAFNDLENAYLGWGMVIVVLFFFANTLLAFMEDVDTLKGKR